MAEIFAAVASGAGLVSLAIQLLESSQKLKGLYNSAKDAPKNVKDLCFDLEILSLQLRQLEQHRQHDHLNTELLYRCIAQCERRAGKVSDVVDDMARYVRRSAAFGKLYAAFREPEVERLLDELERAKSSLSLTYISYCQAWNMRNAAAHASTLQSYGDVLAMQQMQLGNLQQDVSDGNARLYDQLEDLKDHRKASKGSHPYRESQDSVTRASNKRYFNSRSTSSMRFRLPMLAWLSGRTWQIAVSQSQASWTLQVHPINYRPDDSLVFRYVQKGDVAAVRALLSAGELSVWDFSTDEFSHHTSLLGLAVKYRRLELCDFLLSQHAFFRSDEQLLTAAIEATTGSRWYNSRMLELFVGKFDMDVDVIDPSSQMLKYIQLSSSGTIEVILSHQSVDLANWPLHERFKIAMRLDALTPLEFQRTLGLPTPSQIAQLHDAHMGTALHWAAKNWYTHAHFRDEYDAIRTDDYNGIEKFLTTLLETKSWLHALDKRGRTPLVCALDITYFTTAADEPWIPVHMIYDDFAMITELWGRLLSDAGVSLPGYVAEENVLLAARDSKDDIRLKGDSSRDVRLSRFVLSEHQSLRLEVTTRAEVDIWEFQPPPGLFPDSHGGFSATVWKPTTDDGDRTFWQKTNSKELRSKPFQWTRSHEIDLETADESRTFRALFVTTNDDHSALALLLGRNQRRRAQGSHCRPRRSSSMPPLRNAYFHNGDPYDFNLYDFQFRLSGGWIIPYLHKCLLDSKWGFRVPTQTYSPEHSWRACMKGCQGRTDYSTMFEEFLDYTASQPKGMASELERIGRIVETEKTMGVQRDL